MPRGYVEVLEELNIPYRTEGHHHCRPGWVQTDCPSCSPGSHSFRMGYSLEGGGLACWACGKMRVIPSLAELANVSESDVRKLMGTGWFEKHATTESKSKGVLTLPDGLDNLLPAHLKFLKGRKISKAKAALHGMKGIGPYTHLRWRVFLPIVHRGQVVSWTTRTILPDEEIRYWSAKPEQEIIGHRKVLFGGDLANNTVIVCEGPFDAIRGGPGFVATFGTAITKAQVLLLSKYHVRVICLDTDKPGRRAAKHLADSLSAFPGATYRVTLDAKDVGSADIQEIRELRSRFLG